MYYKQTATKSIDNTDSPYTLEPNYRVIIVDTSGGDVTITLPTVASLGIIFTTKIIHATGGGTLTINPNAADTINNALTTYVSTEAGECLTMETVAANQICFTTNLAVGGGYLEKELQFSSDLDTVREITFIGALTVDNIVMTAGIDAVDPTYEVSDDDGATWDDAADIAAINTWIGVNVTGDYTSGTKWRLRLTAAYETGITNLQTATIIYSR